MGKSTCLHSLQWPPSVTFYLKDYPFCCNWWNFILFNGWVIILLKIYKHAFLQIKYPCCTRDSGPLRPSSHQLQSPGPGLWRPWHTLKNKNHVIISINAEKAFNKIQCPFILKLLKNGYRRSITQHNKGHHIWQVHNLNHTQWWNLKTFPLRSGTRQGYPFSTLLFNVVLEVPATTNQTTKIIQIGKEEVKLVANVTILYTENFKEFTKKMINISTHNWT